MYQDHRRHSTLKTVLLALVPYSRQNLKLSFSPNRFFNDLEATSGYSYKVLRQAYRRGQERRLILFDLPKLTSKGYREIQPFIAQRLKNKVKLMVIFDIPEKRASTRHAFRTALKTWQFKQIQKSVWVTELDFRDALIDIIDELKLHDCVELYESSRLYP